MTSCNGRNVFQTSHDQGNSKNSAIAKGDTVPGLSDVIMVIYQDKLNNYWFGSRGQGVFRYDGKKIDQFTTKHGLISNDIWGIQGDGLGNIYFDTQDGVSQFDGQIYKEEKGIEVKTPSGTD